MESAGTKASWKSFATSVFGDGGRAGRGRDVRQPKQQNSDSFGTEDDTPDEDISLLENRPVDQKLLRKRSQGHTQKMLLDDAKNSSSKILSAGDLRQRSTVLPKPLCSDLKSDDNNILSKKQFCSSFSASNSSSFSSHPSAKQKSNPVGTAGMSLRLSGENSEEHCLDAPPEDGVLLRQDGEWTPAAAAASSAREKHRLPTPKTSGKLGTVARNSVLDGMLIAKQFTKEPALGNLIDFESDGFNN